LFEEFKELSSRLWSGEVEALAGFAPQFLQQKMLVKFLHPFGHCSETEVTGQRQYRPNQSGWLRAVGDIDHEGAVDLERVDRDLVE
jgi:hypothetical protein